mgnify:CR=1 FL=1
MRKTLKRGGGNLNKQIDLGKNAFVIKSTYPKSVANWPAWTGSPQSWPGPSCKGNYLKYNNKPNLPYPKFVGGKSKRRRNKRRKRQTLHKRQTLRKQHNRKNKRKHTRHNKKNKRYKGGARWSWTFPFNSIEQGLYYNSKRLYNSFFGRTNIDTGKTNLDPNYQPNSFSYN